MIQAFAPFREAALRLKREADQRRRERRAADEPEGCRLCEFSGYIYNPWPTREPCPGCAKGREYAKTWVPPWLRRTGGTT